MKNKILITFIALSFLSLVGASYAGSIPGESLGSCTLFAQVNECKPGVECLVNWAGFGDTCVLNGYGSCGSNLWMKHDQCPAAGTAYDGKAGAIWGGGPLLFTTWKYNPPGDSAVWDSSDSKLITCNTKLRMEDKVWADTKSISCVDGSCSPKEGDQQCEALCGASSFFDELPANFPWILANSVKCNGVQNAIVLPQQSLTISYDFNGAPSEPLSIQQILLNDVVIDEYRETNVPSCSWNSRSRGPFTARLTTGTYTYTVKTWSGNINDQASCTVQVVECVVDNDCGTTPNPQTGIIPYCDSPEGKTKNTINPPYTCVRPRTCTTNADCRGLGQTDRCCVDDPNDPNSPKTGKGTCEDKGTFTKNARFLCDPGVWIKCDSNKVNSVQSFDGKSFKCVVENGEYKWIDASVDTSGQISSNENVNIFSIVISFLKNLFRL